ncbi:MAG: phosphatidate cytidylyltransferase [Betaproteobacteria bacterium]|nr:MAG: phosphatidate cytidylyltransferase [Betaproteobacteria bacterium]
MSTLTHFQGTLLISAGVILLLVAVSALGAWLKLSAADGHPHPLIDNLNLRIQAWWMMTVTIGVALLAGRTGVIVLFAFVSFTALREFLTIAPTRRGDHQALVMAFFVVLPFQYFLIGLDWYGMYAVFIPVYAFLFLPILSAVKADARNFMERTGTIQWALMVTVFCISHIPALLNVRIPGYEGRNVFLIVFLVLIVQSGDILHHVCSRICGRHQIAPQVSPNKTVEGFIGGIAAAVVLGMLLSWMTPFAVTEAALVSLATTLMGFFGGLVLSAMKRDRGIRDWGIGVEGGGMLDRVASVCFAAPVYFHLVRHWWSV